MKFENMDTYFREYGNKTSIRLVYLSAIFLALVLFGLLFLVLIGLTFSGPAAADCCPHDQSASSGSSSNNSHFSHPLWTVYFIKNHPHLM